MNLNVERYLRGSWQSGDGSALLRPWWGMSPSRLLIRAVVQGAVAVVLLVVLMRMRSGELLADDDSLDALGDARPKVMLGALVLAILAGLWLLYSVARVLVGIVELSARQSFEGTVVSVRERRAWGFLPGFVQAMIWDRRDQPLDRRRLHTILTLQTDTGTRVWNVSSRKAAQLQPGQEIRVVVTPINGYVRTLEPLRAG